MNLDHQPVMISFDVEYNPVSRQEIGATITGFDVGGGFPMGVLGFFFPGFQGIFCVRVFRPTRDQFLSGDDVHLLFYPFLGNILVTFILFWE
jgi:hypothetical protein